MQWCRKEIDAVAGQVRNPNLGVVLYLSYRMQHGMQHVATLSAPHEVSSLSRCRYLPRSFVVQMSGLRSSMTALQGDIAAQALHSRHVSQRSDEAYEQVHPLSLSASQCTLSLSAQGSDYAQSTNAGLAAALCRFST